MINVDFSAQSDLWLLEYVSEVSESVAGAVAEEIRSSLGLLTLCAEGRFVEAVELQNCIDSLHQARCEAAQSLLKAAAEVQKRRLMPLTDPQMRAIKRATV